MVSQSLRKGSFPVKRCDGTWENQVLIKENSHNGSESFLQVSAPSVTQTAPHELWQRARRPPNKKPERVQVNHAHHGLAPPLYVVETELFRTGGGEEGPNLFPFNG